MAKLLIFNWKMNPVKLQEALGLAKASDFKNVVIAPPFTFIEEVGKKLKRSKLGAQDLFWEAGGAFTGEISPKELKNLKVKYVILGHSERRHKLGETDLMIEKKVAAAAENRLVPVLCVGETRQEKISGHRFLVLRRQLGIDLPKSLIVAYEPVWAIGSGNPELPESALATIKFIKELLAKRKIKAEVLYGGSVNSKNLKDYLQYKEVDGALVGGASLKKEEIKKMVKLAAGR